MRCPYCGGTDSRVIESRPANGGYVVRRARECERCFARFRTYEIATAAYGGGPTFLPEDLRELEQLGPNAGNRVSDAVSQAIDLLYPLLGGKVDWTLGHPIANYPVGAFREMANFKVIRGEKFDYEVDAATVVFRSGQDTLLRLELEPGQAIALSPEQTAKFEAGTISVTFHKDRQMWGIIGTVEDPPIAAAPSP